MWRKQKDYPNKWTEEFRKEHFLKVWHRVNTVFAICCTHFRVLHSLPYWRWRKYARINFTERAGVTGWFSNWTGTSVDNDAQNPNNWLDQWQSGKASIKCTVRNMSRWCGVVLHNVSTQLSREPIPFNLIYFLFCKLCFFHMHNTSRHQCTLYINRIFTCCTIKSLKKFSDKVTLLSFSKSLFSLERWL